VVYSHFSKHLYGQCWLDFTKRNGTGGESIYGSPFPDEDLTRSLDAEGYDLSP